MDPWLWRRNGRKLWTHWEMKDKGHIAELLDKQIDPYGPITIHGTMAKKPSWDHITIPVKRWISSWSKFFSFSIHWNLRWRIKTCHTWMVKHKPTIKSSLKTRLWMSFLCGRSSRSWIIHRRWNMQKQISSQRWCLNACILANFPWEKLVKMNKHLSTFKSALHIEGSQVYFTSPN